MLSERLKNHDLKFEQLVGETKKEAKDMLAEVSEMLVLSMRVAENYGRMTRDEVEEYTLKCIEFYEAKYYSDENFGETVRATVKRWA